MDAESILLINENVLPGSKAACFRFIGSDYDGELFIVGTYGDAVQDIVG